MGILLLWFAAGLVGVLLTSHWIVESAVAISRYAQVSEALIGMTVIATAVTAARKGHGGIVVGNILGADILNICWIAGASAVVNPLNVGARVIHFAFPAMLVIVGAMLVMMRTGYRLTKSEGVVLLALYGVYLFLMVKLFL